MKTKVSKKTTAVAVRRKAEVQKASAGVAAISAVDPQALLVRAIDKNLPIESMERLLAMRDKMKAEYAREQFFTALAGFQSECPVVDKTHEILNKDKKTVRSRYAAIEDMAIVAGPHLEHWGFSWTCKPSQTDEKVKAVFHLHHKDGHEEITEFEVPLDPNAYMSNPQKAGAALTFATRYAFKFATGIQTKGEDNDAQDDDEPRRTPISQPQARTQEAAVPVQHAEKKNLSDYEKVLLYIKATETDPKSKQTVGIFNENEQIDYTHEANGAKGNPKELTRILADIIETGGKRRKVIRGAA